MIKVSCEVPYNILEQSKKFNDYEYCLAHEYQKSIKYKMFYNSQRDKGRQIYLDCGAFELGCSIPIKDYLEVINELKPDVVFLPDCYTDNSEQAVDRIIEFKESLKNVVLEKSPIWCAIVHGSSLEDAMETWWNYTTNPEIKDFIGMIALSKSLLLKESEIQKWKEKYHLEDNPYTDFNRYLFFYTLLYHGEDFEVKYNNEPLHLLGNYGAFEFKNELYKKLNIVSVDSSHPVMVALDSYAKGKSYSEYNTRDYGIQYRDKHCVTPVLANNMNREITEDELKKIEIYVQEYKDLVNHNI